MPKPQYFFANNPKSEITRCPSGMGEVKKELDKYTRAAVNLYGVILIDDMVELFKHYTSHELTNDLVYQLLLPLAVKKTDYFFFNKTIIVNEYFLDLHHTEFLEVNKIQSNYDRYVPETKEEFLKYTKSNYNDNPYIEKMKDFFMAHIKPYGEDAAKYLLDELMEENVLMGKSASEASQILKSGIITSEVDDKLKAKFKDLYLKLYTRQRSIFMNGLRLFDVPEDLELTYESLL